MDKSFDENDDPEAKPMLRRQALVNAAPTLTRLKTQFITDSVETEKSKLDCKSTCAFTNYSCKCATFPIIIIFGSIPALINLAASEWVRRWMDNEPQ